MVLPATVSAVAGSVLQRLTCSGRADLRRLAIEAVVTHDGRPRHTALGHPAQFDRGGFHWIASGLDLIGGWNLLQLDDPYHGQGRASSLHVVVPTPLVAQRLSERELGQLPLGVPLHVQGVPTDPCRGNGD